jgi:hypothetical protein
LRTGTNTTAGAGEKMALKIWMIFFNSCFIRNIHLNDEL